MKGFILYSDPIGQELGRGREVTVHGTVKAAIDYALREGGAIFRPPGDEDYWTSKARRAIELGQVPLSNAWDTRCMELVIVRGKRSDVVIIRQCEVVQ